MQVFYTKLLNIVNMLNKYQNLNIIAVKRISNYFAQSSKITQYGTFYAVFFKWRSGDLKSLKTEPCSLMEVQH